MIEHVENLRHAWGNGRPKLKEEATTNAHDQEIMKIFNPGSLMQERKPPKQNPKY
jgi:hypothetical protein